MFREGIMLGGVESKALLNFMHQVISLNAGPNSWENVVATALQRKAHGAYHLDKAADVEVCHHLNLLVRLVGLNTDRTLTYPPTSFRPGPMLSTLTAPFVPSAAFALPSGSEYTTRSSGQITTATSIARIYIASSTAISKAWRMAGSIPRQLELTS